MDTESGKDALYDPGTACVRVRLGARGLTKRFGALVANDRVDFAVAPGTVHAIVGGNGAGKSTLMRILQGVQQPDDGSVIVNDRPVVLDHPRTAFAHGIGMVHQEFMLVPGLSLLENLILAREPVGRLSRIARAEALAGARRLEALAGVTLDWDQPEEEAPMHVRQILEILRLIYRGADVLILDEPTAVLAPAQVRDLLALLTRLRAEGRTIIFISHKLDEVLAIADQITVFRAGRVVGSVSRAEADKAVLARMMIGDVLANLAVRDTPPGAPVLELRRLVVRDPRGRERLRGLDLRVRAGEIVGIGGIAENGQEALAGAVSGLLPVHAGSITLDGRELGHHDNRQRRALGLHYLSPDRAGEGLCLSASIRDNALCGHQRRAGLSRQGWLRAGAIARHVGALLDRYQVRRDGDTRPVASLSGGNQQRVAMARELEGAPRLLVACQPTRGVDIGGTAFIHQCLLDYRDRGGAVLLVSEELDELVALCDRVIVLYAGQAVGELKRGSGAEDIGRLMLGQLRADAANGTGGMGDARP